MDVDIIVIDKKIRDTFISEKSSLPKYKEQLQNMTDMLRNTKLSYRIRSTLEHNTRELEQHIDDLTSDRSYNFYLLESIPILEKYKKILKQPIKLSFMGKAQKDSKEKVSIVTEYITLAKKYVDIEVDLKKERDEKMACKNPNCTKKTNLEVIDDNIYICVNCGSQQEEISHTSSYNDVDRVNISTKYVYDRRVHFRDAIKQYQGKQNSTIHPKVYKDLEKQLELHGLLIGNKNTSKENRFSKIERFHISMFLKETGHTKHYEDVVLIHSNITGKKPDDISHLEEVLLNDFDILTELYDKKYANNNKINRKNFINTQSVLYQLLLKHGYPAKKEDFNILKTQ